MRNPTSSPPTCQEWTAIRSGSWYWDSLMSSLVHSDKYALRFVRPLKYRVVAFKFYRTSCRYSDTVAFYFDNYASWNDAVQAARNWTLRGELEHGDPAPYALALYTYIEVDPTVERQSW